MVYVIRHTAPSNFQILAEMTAHDARLAIAGKHDQACHGVWFERCTKERAHDWVRRGDIHSTLLYLDMDGRIRRARDDR